MRSKLWKVFSTAIALAILGPAALEVRLSRAGEPQESAKPETRRDGPVPIFVNAATDLQSLLKRYDQPDFVILRGDEYDRLLGKQKSAATPIPLKPGRIVESVSLAGRIKDDVVEFNVDYGVSSEIADPAWIPIRLDGLTLSGALENDRDLPLRVRGGVWEVELTGKGRHLVKVRFFMKVRQTAEGNRLELAIPEAASTHLTLDVPRRVTEARAGPGESLTRESLKETSRTRLSADLIPRSKLDLTWINEEEAVAQLPPLLVAQAEMAVDIDLGSLRAKTSWAIRSARGVARSLELILNLDDEVLELELDGQVPPAGIERGATSTRLTIPLTEVLGPGQERKLVMTTRRPIAGQTLTEFTFKGFPITNAREQTGAIGIVQSGNLGVSAIPGRGIRQIDPRTELPGTLRARPATTLAYQFSEQPFDLHLRIEPSPPLVRTESKTTVLLRPDLAIVDTWIDFQAARGRLFEISLSASSALKIDSIGPPDVVRTWQSGSLPSALSPGGPAGGVQLLTVKLAQKIQEGGRFSIHVKGSKAIDRLGDVGISLVEPVGTISGGGRIAVVPEASLTAELAEASKSSSIPSPFRGAIQSPPADWPWPAEKPSSTVPALWLRYDLSPSELPLKVTFHPKGLKESTELNIKVSADLLDVRQETECTPRFGTFDTLDILVPEAVEGTWEVEGAAVDHRFETKPVNRGERLVRLKLFSELTQSTRLTFHYRLPVRRGPSPDEPLETALPWIRLAGATQAVSPLVAKILSDPGTSVECADPLWKIERNSSSSLNRGDFTLTSQRVGAGTLRLKVFQRSLAALPSVVVSRHWIRTSQNSRGELFHKASYWVERHEGALTVRLPSSVRLSMAKVGGEAIAQVEELAREQGLRIRFPSKVGREPVLVELEYSSASQSTSSAWSPPKLLGDGLIQQTFWETRLPWNVAVVGTPRGWLDENEWYWDFYVWKRRPKVSTSDLSAWINGKTAATPVTEPGRAGTHAYLFGYSGPPGDLAIKTASRALLVGLCSGTVLALGGLFVVVWHPPIRALGFAVLTTLFVSILVFDPDVLFLGVQSGFIGIILTLLLGLMQRIVDRRNPAAKMRADAGSSSVVIPVGSTVSRTVGVGSDDSTAIRARPPESVEPASKPSANGVSNSSLLGNSTSRTSRSLGS